MDCVVDNSVDSANVFELDVPNFRTALILPDFRPLWLRGLPESDNVVDQQSDLLSDYDDSIKDHDPEESSEADDHSDSDSSVISYKGFCDYNNNAVVHKPVTSVISVDGSDTEIAAAAGLSSSATGFAQYKAQTALPQNIPLPSFFVRCSCVYCAISYFTLKYFSNSHKSSACVLLTNLFSYV